jgi:hypothetical protein
MRRLVCFVSLLGFVWLPSAVAAQYEEYPPEEEPPAVEVEVGVEEPPPQPLTVEPSYAETPPPTPPDYQPGPSGDERAGFLVEIQPYGFLPLRISGDTALGGETTPVNVRMRDLFEGDQVNIAGGLRLEAWANRLGLIVDGTYLQIERDSFDGTDTVDFRSRQFIGDFLGGLRVFQSGPLAGGPSVGFGLTGGVRMIYDRENLTVGGNAVERSDWIAKGSLGANIPIRFSDSFGLRARGAVRYPDLGWTVVGLMEFDALPVGVDVGYRYDKLNYEEGGLDLDVDLHSVYLGLGFQAGGRRDRRSN